MKDLYRENAAVAALGDAEVAELRAARATVVEGSTLKPVLQFSQAGAVLLQWHGHCCLVSTTTETPQQYGLR